MTVRRMLCALAVFVAAFARAEEVPYVQTPQNVVEAMLELAGVRGTDFLIDLGSGDGRIVITAARKYGASGIGVDYDDYLVRESTEKALEAGVADRVRFVKEDFFETDLSAASVVTMYLLPEFNLRLRPKLVRELRAGSRIVSHDWDLGEAWAPAARIEVPAPEKTVGLKKVSTLFLFVVPAQVAGRWETRVPVGDGATDVVLEFEQSFQQLGGTARIDGAARPIERAEVKGRYVAFRVDHPAGGTIRFQGDASADRIVGQVSTPDGRNHPWRALRVK
jgi:SAM-dependent methyltransferase